MTNLTPFLVVMRFDERTTKLEVVFLYKYNKLKCVGELRSFTTFLLGLNKDKVLFHFTYGVN